MRRSDWVNAAIIGAAVGAGVLFLVDRDKPTTKEQAGRAGMLLRVFRQDEVTRITIDRRGEKIELVREGDQWRLVSPRVAKSDFLAVTSLLNTLQGARAERALGKVSPSERVQLGLDAPRAKVQIAMKGITLDLALGAPATGSGGGASSMDDAGPLASYVEVAPVGEDKGGVFVVAPDVVAAIDRPADAYRDPSLLASNASTTFTKIVVKKATGPVLELERREHGTWKLLQPGVFAARANADVVDGLLRAFYELRADPFVPDTTPIQVEDAALGGILEITLVSGEKVEATFGGPCPTNPKLVVAQLKATPPSTGCVPALTTARILTPGASYADGRAFGLLPGTESAKTSEIEALTIETNGTKIVEAERRGDGLHLRVPVDEQVEKDSTDRYFGRLAAIEGAPVTPPPDLAPLGLSPPAGRAIIKRRVAAVTLGPSAADGGSELWEQVVEIGTPMPLDPAKKDGPMVVHLRRVDDGVVLRVPLAMAESIRAGAAHELRNPNLLAMSPEVITKVTTKPAGGDAIGFELERTSNLWQLLAPKGLGVDPAAASGLTRQLATLTCLRWMDKDDGTFGSAPTLVTLERDLSKAGDAGIDKTTILELGATTPDGGVMARIRGRDPVCVIPDGKRDAILRPPVDLRSVGFDASLTPRIVVTREGRTRALAFQDATKSWTDGGDAGMAEVTARKLADVVMGFRAEAVVHLGPAKKEHGFDTPLVVVDGSDGKTSKRKLVIGVPGKVANVPVYYARVDGQDVTWAILREDVERLLELL